MTLRAYLIVMGFATVIAVSTLFLVLFHTDPFEATFFELGLFYVSLLMVLVGILSMVGFVIRTAARRGRPLFALVVVSFRQAVLFSVLITGSLFLYSKHLLSIWNSIMFIGVLTLIEFFFLSAGHRQPGAEPKQLQE